jgi:hypothetical protein
LVQAFPAAVVLAGAARAQAAVSVAELALVCDTTLGPAMRAAAAVYGNTTGVRVSVFPTAPGLIVPQLERYVQNDIVVTQRVLMDKAAGAGVVASGAAHGAWYNRLVVAGKQGAPFAPPKPIAASDPSPASDMDGPAILARLGLLPATVLGVIDTDTVAALLLDGTASRGLLHMTDIHAHRELEVMTVVSDDVESPIAYTAAVTQLARRPNPAGFLEFLISAQATTLLAAQGLATQS